MSLAEVKPGQVITDGMRKYEVLTFPSYKAGAIMVEVRKEDYARDCLIEYYGRPVVGNYVGRQT